MKEAIEILNMMQEKWGTKFMLTAIFLYGDWSLMQSSQVDALYGLICGVAVVLGYFTSRHIQEINVKE